MAREILLIGVGNEFRGDDAVGVLVAREFSRRNLLGVKVIESSGEGISLMESWEGSERVMIVDAITSGSAPGTVHRLELWQEQMRNGFAARSSHTFGVAEAVALSRELDRLPPGIILYGIEGSAFEIGAPLSGPVAAQMPVLIRSIERDILQSKGTDR